MSRFTVLTCCLLASLLRPALAFEDWSGAQPPVADGLLLWLDAASQPRAWNARGKPPLRDGSPLDVWYDASGGGRHLVQRLLDSVPRFHTNAGSAWVRFDGTDDFLAATNQRLGAGEVTLFLVAAPHSNSGGFRGLFAAGETGKNDYTTGITVDLDGGASERFRTLNVEGRGFGGARDLLRGDDAFGAFHVLSVVAAPGAEGVRLYAGGVLQGSRPREAGAIALEEITAGARFYSNAAEPPSVHGFLDGDLAAVLLYGRALEDAERARVEEYLAREYGALLAGPPSPDGIETGGSLRRVRPGAPGGPPVQVFVPGFEVRKLPVELTNINNLRYRPDGKLVALAYSGAIYLLSDTDGDGLEEQVETFWERGSFRGPIGLALLPPGHARGSGVFVASKGKVSLILDTSGDDRGDVEEVVATGWQEIPQAVDTLGVALDREGNVYFGIGCADFTNPYLVDGDGKAHYDVESARGTIQKLSADFSRRETVCTGVRFTVGLAMNREGDLFATDQEGATWLPGGNPLDEVLHIQPGRHYGFPPRHPRHLPGVIDEPAAAELGPQHQSTCGLVFNEASGGRRVFGPSHWEGDLFVAGYSRGKVWRVRLVKTPSGYVARSSLFASSGLLAVDAEISPAGHLVLACHSGAPDWGSGPDGEGALYQIAFVDLDAPQPVIAWAAGPLEVRTAFDRPLGAVDFAALEESVEITCGEHVRAGDRFEIHRPGYKVVEEELAAPRYRVKVRSAGVAPDGRTVVLRTDPHPVSGTYAIRMPLGDGSGREIDIDYTLAGVEASWTASDGSAEWAGWLPHVDFDVCRRLLAGTAHLEALERVLARPGELVLRSRLERFPAGARLRIRNMNAVGERNDSVLELRVATDSSWQPSATYSTEDDPRERPLALEDLRLPWAPAALPPSVVPEAQDRTTTAAALAGGNWLRGREVFFGEGKCGTCHALRSEGRDAGPDLTNLVHRDAASVLRDISRPSAAIHPDYVTYTVILGDGTALTGLLRSRGTSEIRVIDSAANETIVPVEKIQEYRSSTVSTMPQGLDEALGPEKMRHLLSFLLAPPPRMPADLEGGPPPRERTEVAAVLGDPPPRTAPVRTLKVVLVACEKDHGPGEHDYPAWQKAWMRLLRMADGVELETAWRWPSPEQLEWADLMVFFFWNHEWTREKTPEFASYLERGGGAVFLHSAVIPREDPESLADCIGLSADPTVIRYRHGPLDLEFEREHPITRGFRRVHFHDESYWLLTGDPSRVNVLATAVEEGEPRPLMWTFGRGKGRVFTSILGHYSWTFDDPLFRAIILRAMAWAAREPVGRFEELATAGVELR